MFISIYNQIDRHETGRRDLIRRLSLVLLWSKYIYHPESFAVRSIGDDQECKALPL